jgi:hypothetical protein
MLRKKLIPRRFALAGGEGFSLPTGQAWVSLMVLTQVPKSLAKIYDRKKIS